MNKVIERIKLYSRLRKVSKKIFEIDEKHDEINDKIDKIWKNKKLHPIIQQYLLDDSIEKYHELSIKRNMLITEQNYVLRKLFK